MEGLVAAEQRHLSGGRKARGVALLILESGQIEAEHGQRPGDGVKVRGDGCSVLGHLGSLIADGAIEVAVIVSDGTDAAEIDELELFLGLDDVVRLEVAIEEPAAVEVPEGRKDLERVRNRLGHRDRCTILLAMTVAHLTQGLATDVLHDDVAGVFVLDEIVDLDDVGVFDLGQESALGDRRGHRRLVVRVEQALEHHPAVRDVPVLRQVHPPEAAVRYAARYLVLAAHEVPGPQFGRERVGRSALRTKALGAPWSPLVAPPDRSAAATAGPLALGDLGFGQHNREGVAVGHHRHLDEPGPQTATVPT